MMALAQALGKLAMVLVLLIVVVGLARLLLAVAGVWGL
jgi:hypothetical protein